MITKDGHNGGKKHTCPRCSGIRQFPCMFYTARGKLTRYAFSCGYQEVKEVSFSIQSPTYRLYLGKEHNTYHVKGFDIIGRRVWESFSTLTAARRFFATFKGKVV